MRKKRLFLLGCASLLGVVLFAGCSQLMYPTIGDVKLLNEANLDFQEDLQKATVQAFTEQHGRMSPANQEWFNAMLAQNAQFVGERKTVALEKAEDAKGLDLTSLAASSPGLAAMLLMFMNSRKPSRAAGQVDKLETDASEAAKKLADLQLNLAIAAGANKAIPSDST